MKQMASQNSTQRYNPPMTQTVMQARARSVNAYNSNQLKKNNNKSQIAQQQQPSQNINLRSASLNKQFNQTAGQQQQNQTIQNEGGQLSLVLQNDPYTNFNTIANTTTNQQQQQQLQAYMMGGGGGPAGTSLIQNQSSIEGSGPGKNGFNTMPNSVTNQQHRRTKHIKAYSMNQQCSQQQQQQQQYIYASQQQQMGATEQFLNQPLQLNQRILNQTLQYGGAPTGIGTSQYTPVSYQTINQPMTNPISYFSQAQSNRHNPSLSINATSNLPYKGYTPKSNNDLMNQIGSQGMNQNSYMYNPFQNYKQGASQSSTRISAAKIKNLNNTITNARSFSNCSNKQMSSSKKSGVSQQQYNNQSLMRGTVCNNTLGNNTTIISESQLLESEEYFEQGKMFLSDKKYKEAIKAFQKSLGLNKLNYDALFYKGVASLDQGQPQKAITDLNELIETCPDYRKTMYIVLSIAYRRINDYTGALRTLSKAVVKYPRYIEAYIARGQIYIFQKKWDKALTDFRIVISLSNENGLGFLGQGDSLKGIGNYNGALLSYSKAIEIDQQCIQQGLMKRGILYLQMKYNDQALQDFNQLVDIAEKDNADGGALAAVTKSYFYKAKALKKLDQCNDAILYFEQVIRQSDDQFLQSSALYEIAKIKIQQKDFYEAYYNLQRATHYKLKQKKLINYKMFTEGVIFLMKRKTKTGIKLLTSLLEKIDPSQSSQSMQTDYITPLIYIYRAYGYFITDDYDKALKDYIKSNQLKKLNNAAYYNMIMTQGLKSLEKKEYENAISFFTKTSQKMPGNRDPYFLRSVSIVRYALHKPIKPLTKNKMLRDAKRDLNRALKHSPKDYQVMYFRGILSFALHYFFDAITDFETVIEKSEETSAKFYLARGRCYACLSMFKEAITDLSIAINLNKDLLDAYLNRGKCAYLIGDTGLAFMDFQKLIVLEPKNPMVHIYAGNLLMTTGSYEDATKAFTNADNIHKSPLALYQRSRCHVALNNMNDALKDLNKVIEISPNDKVAVADKECLTALKTASSGIQQNTQPLERGIYEKSVIILTKLISYEKNEHLAKINHDSSIMHQHSQIIPSAQRTKTDKIRAIRRRREQDKQAKNQGENLRKNDLRFRVAQPDENGDEEEYEELSEIDEKELEKLNKQIDEVSQATSKMCGDDEELKEEETNYYKENIFNKEDYYLYRAVMYFYAGEYEKSICDFEQSSSIMHSSKVLYPRNQFPDDEDLDGNADNLSQASSQTDLSDVGLCSLNIHEYSFNTILNLIQMKEYKKSLTKLDYILDTIPKKYASQIWLIRAILNQHLGHQQQAKKDFKRANKYDKDNAYKFLDQKQNIQLNIFPQQQRLCNSYAYVKFSFPGYSNNIFMKPSFSFPFIKPPNMIPCVDNSVLDQFTIKAIPLKPEAPWIKKCSFGIKFTEEIYFTDDDREATPDEEKEYKQRKQQQQQRARAAAYIRSFSEKVILRNKIFMKEDDDQNQQKQVQLAGEHNEFEGIGNIEEMVAAGRFVPNDDYYEEDEYEEVEDEDADDDGVIEEKAKQRLQEISRLSGIAAAGGQKQQKNAKGNSIDNSFLAEINRIIK